jgi:hypothetical protein
MTNNKIQTLIASCIEQLRSDGYAEQCIDMHQRRWQKGIVSFMEKMGTDVFTTEIGEAFLSEILSGLAGSTQRAHRRSIHLLDEFMKTGKV